MAENFQGFSSEQGRLFEEQCEQALRYAGFDISGRRLELGGALADFRVTAQSGSQQRSFYVVCKGSIRGSRPGLLRTDTLRKAAAEAYAISAACPLPPGYDEDDPKTIHIAPFEPVLAGGAIVLTSHIPERGAGAHFLWTVYGELFWDVLTPWPAIDCRRLRFYATATRDELWSDFLQRELMARVVAPNNMHEHEYDAVTLPEWPREPPINEDLARSWSSLFLHDKHAQQRLTDLVNTLP